MMNKKNHTTPAKKYKTLISSIHSIYRVVNSTFEARELIMRLSRLICQIFDARYCLVLLLDSTKKYSIFKCLITNKKKNIIDKRTKISNRMEKRIIKTAASIRQNNLLGLPLV